MGITREVGTTEVEGDNKIYAPVDPDPDSLKSGDPGSTEESSLQQDEK